MTKEVTKEKKEQKTKKEQVRELVLVNDDHHTFDYVIDALIKVCEHTEEQAAQCTLITHYKGKCNIKKGPFSVLRPMRQALLDKELKAIIN